MVTVLHLRYPLHLRIFVEALFWLLLPVSLPAICVWSYRRSAIEVRESAAATASDDSQPVISV